MLLKNTILLSTVKNQSLLCHSFYQLTFRKLADNLYYCNYEMQMVENDFVSV